MIPWVTIRPVLLSLFSDLGGLQTVWTDKQRPYIDPDEQAILLLRERSTQDVGVDDCRYRDLDVDPPAFTLEERINGMRLVSLDVRVESFRHDDDRFAFNAIGQIRTKLRFASSRSRLRAQNLSIVKIGQALDLTGVVKDDRATSVAILDLTLNVGITTADVDNLVPSIEAVDNPVDHANTEFN